MSTLLVRSSLKCNANYVWRAGTFASLLLGGWLGPAGAQEAVEREGVSLAYWRLTSPVADRLIVVVHGGPGVTHDYLRPEMDRLARWGEVVYYDQRGCGASSEARSYGWRDHVEDLHYLITELRKGRKVLLVGSSWGATLAKLYLTIHREELDAVVFSGPTAARGKVPETLQQRLVRCQRVNAETLESLRDVPSTARGLQLHRLTFEDSGDGGVEDPGLSCTFLECFATLPSHDPWFTHPGAFWSVLEEFLAKVEGLEGARYSRQLTNRVPAPLAARAPSNIARDAGHVGTRRCVT